MVILSATDCPSNIKHQKAKKFRVGIFTVTKIIIGCTRGLCAAPYLPPCVLNIFLLSSRQKYHYPLMENLLRAIFLPFKFPHRHRITVSAFIFSLVGGNKIIANYRTKLPYYHTHILPYFTLVVIIPILVHRLPFIILRSTRYFCRQRPKYLICYSYAYYLGI